MNHATKTTALPSLIGDVLTDPARCIDNLFADTWKALKFNGLLKATGFTKRSGISIAEATFLLLLWKWLNVSSIAMFSRKALETFSNATRDVMYDLLKREDISWRALNRKVARTVHRHHGLATSPLKVFVLDDSIKARRGKKMEGVSSHFDHTTHRHVMGQQVLTLGLATDEAFLPLDSQIFVSNARATPLIRPHKDGRSVAARRYEEAITQTKPRMAAGMMKRALRSGLDAEYLVADAWFGTKPMIRTALEIGVCPVLRMKKGNMKYRLMTEEGESVLLDAKALHAQVVRKQWRKVSGLPWKAVSLEVELNLSEDSQKPDWQPVKLLFVRGLKAPEETDAGKKDWALFLTTDTRLSMLKMLEVYALRWGIEVYFKEAKQHLGFLAEQTTRFASHTASIHLCAIRYLMLVHAKLEGMAARIGEARSSIQDSLNAMSLAGNLWQLFRSVISGSLHELQDRLGCSVETVMQVIDERIHAFLARSLQLDVFTLRSEHEQ